VEDDVTNTSPGPAPYEAGAHAFSFVIPVYRGGRHIAPCLAAVAAARGSHDNVLVVFDGPPTDDELRAATEGGAEVISLPENRGPAVARNAGAAAATNDALLFVDVDVRITPAAVGVARAALADGWDAVVGAYLPNVSEGNRITKLKNLQHSFVHTRHAGPVATFWTGCSAVSRAAWLKVGGFDDDLRYCEDIAFGVKLHRAGVRILMEPRMSGSHRKEYSLGKWFRSDLYERAIPWSRLLFQGRAIAGQLNTGTEGRIGMVLALLTPVSIGLLAVTPWTGIAVALCVLAMVVLHRKLLGYAARHVDRTTTAMVIPYMYAHYWVGGLGLGMALATGLPGATGARKGTARSSVERPRSDNTR
jgi:GT2 family glycosyltransferase